MTATDLATVERRLSERITPETSRALRLQGTSGLVVADMAQLLEFAKIMAIGGVAVPKYLRGNPGACIAVTLNALEWGFSPFNVANKSYSVNDRIAYEAGLVHAVILKRAPCSRPASQFFGEGPGRYCVVTAKLREDGSVIEYQSPPVGKIPVKNSPLWTNDPDQQLHYYSVRAFARRHFPEVLLGVIEREEARYGAIDAEEGDAPPPPRPNQSLDRKLAALAQDDEPEYMEEGMGPTPDDEETRLPETEETVETPQVPDHLLAAARRGNKALKLAIGKLEQRDYDALTQTQIDYLGAVSKHATMKEGE